MFVDRVRILIRSGAGGKGAISFLREKFKPNGGPAGGDGGKGGNIYFKGNRNLNTLAFFKYTKTFQAENGSPGEKQNRTGKDGQDLYLDVPLGTEIILENGTKFDIIDENPVMILMGGKGGIGNAKLATSINQTPRYTIPNGTREESYAFLNLKIIGDIGLVGKPNAGKSSFITSITNSKSIVADYEFTTTQPHLGTYRELVFVDIPGIIEGASQGKGMGLKFLSHIERCKLLLIIIDINDEPLKTLEMLLKEMSEYGIKKNFLVVLNKIDICKNLSTVEKELINHKFSYISVKEKIGINNLLKNPCATQTQG